MRPVLLILAVCALGSALRANRIQITKRRAKVQQGLSQEEFESFRKSFAKLGIDFVDHFTGLATVGAKLQEGGNGAVFKGKLTEDGSAVAIKVAFEHGNGLDEIKDLVKAEGDLLEALNGCPNMLKVKKIFVAPKAEFPMEIQNLYPIGDKIVGLIMSLSRGGDLFDKWGDCSTAQRYVLMEQYATSLKCMYDAGYVHADIKPENLMIDWDSDNVGANPVAVVIDVGLTKKLDEAIATCEGGVRLGGTPGYWPPCIEVNKKADCAKGISHWDEFSLGVTFEFIGAEKSAGAKAKELAALMKVIPDDQVSRWQTFIDAFKLGQTETAKGGGEAAKYALDSPGGGYFKA